MERLAGPSRASLRGVPLDGRRHMFRCPCRVAALPVTNTAGPYRRPPAPGGGAGGGAPRPGGTFAPRPGSGASFTPRPPGTGPSFSKGPPKPGGPGGDGAPGRGPPRQGFQRRPSGPPPPPLNDQITAAEVRLIGAGPDKPALGVVKLQEALALAKEAGTDLVMISPDASPPVCRIIDYSKFRYEQEQKAKEAKKKMAASRQEQKELKMRYNIGQADYEVRLRAAQRFLKDGDKVKLICQFKGREMEFKQIAFDLFTKFSGDLKDECLVEVKPTIEGRTMLMVLIPPKTNPGDNKPGQGQQAKPAAPKPPRPAPPPTAEGASPAAPAAPTTEDAPPAAPAPAAAD